MLKYIRSKIYKLIAWQRVRDSKDYLEVGVHTYGIENIHLHRWNEENFCQIGSYCSIADSVHIFLGGNHRMDWATTFPFSSTSAIAKGMIRGSRVGCVTSRGDVRIGNDVWIGSHASIMSGVSIGNGAVIGAFAHVVKDVRPYEIVGGNPARPIGFRFENEIIERLERLAWWDWPEDVVLSNVELLCTELDFGSLDLLEQLNTN